MTRAIKCGLGTFLFITLASLFLAGCRSTHPAYTLTGRVISKQPANQQLIIDNDDIPGFMPAMTMPYAVRDPDGFTRVQPGDIIRADVITVAPGQFWLERLAVTGKVPASPSAEGQVPHALMIGDKVPDVPMVNQDGKTIHFSQFKGKIILLTFIYTRCPFPDYCPLLTRQFATIQKELAKNPDEYNRTQLLSITLDPTYDKPAILRGYGLSNMDHDPKGFAHWNFVSTSGADLQKLTASFGLSYSEQDGQVSHSMNTVLLAADGTVATMWPGNEWQTSEVLAVMRHTLTLSESGLP